ncbi:hypothetical protein ACW5R3_09010 [Bizionia sp. KMM 8389]
MKASQILCLGLFLMVFSTGFSQSRSVKDAELQEAKVDTVYSVQERANIQRWFYERVNEMKLKPEVRDDYDRIVNNYVFQMGRLNDSDHDFTRDEIHEKFNALVDRMNNEIKPILTSDQYINHLENFGQIQRSVYRRWNFED